MQDDNETKTEDIITSRADDVMAYSASKDPDSVFYEIEIVIERWNGKGITAISIYGAEEKAERMSAFVERFFRETLGLNGPITRMARAGGGFVVTVSGKKADIERKIVKVFTLYFTVEKERLERAARVSPSGLVTVSDPNVIEMVKRGRS